jgi:hypothetical protein
MSITGRHEQPLLSTAPDEPRRQSATILPDFPRQIVASNPILEDTIDGFGFVGPFGRRSKSSGERKTTLALSPRSFPNSGGALCYSSHRKSGVLGLFSPGGMMACGDFA